MAKGSYLCQRGLRSTPEQEKMEEKHYLNRDLSWLEFNRRVFREAQDESVPLLERVKFLAILARCLIHKIQPQQNHPGPYRYWVRRKTKPYPSVQR